MNIIYQNILYHLEKFVDRSYFRNVPNPECFYRNFADKWVSDENWMYAESASKKALTFEFEDE